MKLPFRIWNPVWILSLASVFTNATAIAANGYANPGSRALADANSAGDFFVSGDNKIVVYRNQFSAARLFKRSFPNEPAIVSGGLIERLPDSTLPTLARVCSQTETILASIDSAGKFKFETRDLSGELNLASARDLRCAVDSTGGSWAALNLKTGVGLIFANADSSNQIVSRFKLPGATGAWSHFLAVGGQFLALNINGQNATLRPDHDNNAQIELLRSPWSEIDPHDTFATRGNVVLRAGQAQVSIAERRVVSGSQTWTDKTNINISPCSETGGCGASLSPDGSWIVAGIWGTYVGKDSKFIRIKTPLVFSESTSPGTALNRKQNKYMIVGDTDADIATLPPEFEKLDHSKTNLKFESEYRLSKKSRFAVWLKGRVDELEVFANPNQTKPRPLFSYSPFSNFVQATGDVIVVEGPVPKKLPNHWAALEPQVEFDAISLANEWIPATQMKEDTPKRPWWVDALQLPKAIAELQASGVSPLDVRVSIVDSGVDLKHPGLRGVFAVNEREVPDNGIDDDENGLVDDVHGYDFVKESGAIEDDFGHGTHVAGLVNNSWSRQVLLGGAFNTRLKIYRALDSQGKSNSIDLARAISAALQSGTDIMNCSWGGGPETQILRDAFAAASRANVIVFSSAGNDALNSDIYPQVPKKFPGIFPIGAGTPSQTKARFSNWGERSVFAFAPGLNIFSTLPEGRFGEKSGTSMASPIAASVASLVLGTLRQTHPEWSSEQQNQATLAALCTGAEKNKLATPFSKCGSINALGALKSSLRQAP
ncbi:MAG: S8 family serine peptidase [Silvanigrellaceae bacterium]